MSKKVEAISRMVFYSQQNPKALAELISGVISDEVTSVKIAGVNSINVPSGDTDATETYTAVALSQYGDEMSDSVTLALDGSVTGVSISDGTVTVKKTATDESFTLKATCGSVVSKLKVTLVPAN